MTRLFKKTETIIIFLVLLGGGLRLGYCICYPVQPRDAYTYESVIREWEESGTIPETIDYFPLSLWILKIPHSIFRYDIVKGGIIINQICGLFLIIFLAIITKKYFRKNYVMIFVGLLVATNPSLVHFSCSFLRENIYLVFATLSLLFLLKYWDATKKRDLLKASMFGALASMCRLEGFEFLVFFLIISFVAFLLKRIQFIKFFVHSVLFFIIFLATTVSVCRIMDFNGVKTKALFSNLKTVEINTL